MAGIVYPNREADFITDIFLNYWYMVIIKSRSTFNFIIFFKVLLTPPIACPPLALPHDSLQPLARLAGNPKKGKQRRPCHNLWHTAHFLSFLSDLISFLLFHFLFSLFNFKHFTKEIAKLNLDLITSP